MRQMSDVTCSNLPLPTLYAQLDRRISRVLCSLSPTATA